MPDLLQFLMPASAAVAVYAAIRADLAALHVKADNANASATSAHQRIDGLLARK